MKQSQTPQHKHDCPCCAFLGRQGLYDLYFHDGGDRPALTTVIARWGPDGSYYSGLCFARTYRSIDGQMRPAIPALEEALDRAIAEGLYAEAVPA